MKIKEVRRIRKRKIKSGFWSVIDKVTLECESLEDKIKYQGQLRLMKIIKIEPESEEFIEKYVKTDMHATNLVFKFTLHLTELKEIKYTLQKLNV